MYFQFHLYFPFPFQAIVSETGGTAVKATALRTDQHYIVYYNFLTKTVITELFPYVSLIFLNACIYREIRRSVKLQQSMRCNQSQNEEIKSANVVVRKKKLYNFVFSILISKCFGNFLPQRFLIHTKKKPIDTTPQLFLEIPFSRISRGENCQQNSQRIHFFKEEGIRKLCYFFLLEIFADVVSMFKIKSSKKRLFTLFYSSFSGWSCCIIYCLSHLENRS